MATEYELKFKATAAVLSDIVSQYPGQWTQIAMQTAYYDTPSGALSARRYTLRRRLENGISVCTLKAPAGNARGEWETQCNTIEAAIDQLLALGCPNDLARLAQEGLVHICGAQFTRLAKTVVLPQCTVELALDRGELTGGGKTLPFCEVEVELKAGTQTQCDAFARALSDRFGLQTEQASKFRRALSLYKGE